MTLENTMLSKRSHIVDDSMYMKHEMSGTHRSIETESRLVVVRGCSEAANKYGVSF